MKTIAFTRHRLIMVVSVMLLILAAMWLFKAHAQCAPSDLACQNYAS